MTYKEQYLKAVHDLGNTDMALNGALYVIDKLINGESELVLNMAERMIETAKKDGRI